MNKVDNKPKKPEEGCLFILWMMLMSIPIFAGGLLGLILAGLLLWELIFG